MAPGDFNGAVALSNSSFTADNKSIPATVHVTTQPIARAVAPLRLRAIQGAAAAAQTVTITNGGRGTLSVSGATTAGGAWLTAAAQASGAVQVKADPASLAPGFYNGTASIASNAANSPLVVPVEFE